MVECIGDKISIGFCYLFLCENCYEIDNAIC